MIFSTNDIQFFTGTSIFFDQFMQNNNYSVMFIPNILKKEMLRKQEKNAVTRGFILATGWGLGLDRFYEGDKKGGILSIIGWGIVFSSFLYLKCSGIEYVDGVKDYSNYSPNPLIVLPLIAGLYGIYLIIKKGFRLAKQFENAED